MMEKVKLEAKMKKKMKMMQQIQKLKMRLMRKEKKTKMRSLIKRRNPNKRHQGMMDKS